MTAKELRSRMGGFILGRLEESGLYVVEKASLDSVLVREKSDVREKPATVELFTHSRKRTLQSIKDTYKANVSQGIHTAHVFLKDGETFFVRLAGRGHIKKRGRSLKNYDKHRVDSMVHLRDTERYALSLFPLDYQRLAYYQPRTERLEESVRIFFMGPVYPDYGHVDASHQGYRHVDRYPHALKDYRETKEIASIQGPAYLIAGKTDAKLALLHEERRVKSNKEYLETLHRLEKELRNVQRLAQ